MNPTRRETTSSSILSNTESPREPHTAAGVGGSLPVEAASKEQKNHRNINSSAVGRTCKPGCRDSARTLQGPPIKDVVCEVLPMELLPSSVCEPQCDTSRKSSPAKNNSSPTTNHHGIPPSPRSVDDCSLDSDWISESGGEEHASSTWSTSWTACIQMFHDFMVTYLILPCTMAAVRRPRLTIASLATAALACFVIGFKQGFYLELDDQVMWTPFNADTNADKAWLKEHSGRTAKQGNVVQNVTRRELEQDADDTKFASGYYDLSMLVHGEGENLLIRRDDMLRMISIIETFRNDTERYNHYCGKLGCHVWGVPRFWNSNTDEFNDRAPNDQRIIQDLSGGLLNVDGVLVPVSDYILYGYPERDTDTNQLKSVKSYNIVFRFRRSQPGARTWGKELLDMALCIDDEWQADETTNLRLEAVFVTSFADEFGRAIKVDIPLVPIIFVCMSLFTYLMFFKRHPVHSRSILGVNAVIAVFLSLAFSFGVSFWLRVPFTSITQLLPFILFGIGLDDAFIVTGSYLRTDTSWDPVDRIRYTMKDIGPSITLTSITSTLAFGLGCLSQIPAVFWLCCYASPAVISVYFYQITFFAACIVLDERRILQKRRDCFVCFTYHAKEEEDIEHNSSARRRDDNLDPNSSAGNQSISHVDRYMEIYGEFLLRRWVRVTVVVGFLLLAAFGAFSASKLRQEFRVTDLLPDDSYVTDFMQAQELSSDSKQIPMTVYFRDVDQSDSNVQQQMDEYIDALVEGMSTVPARPDYFWLWHLRDYVATEGLEHLSFNEQLDSFFSIKLIDEIYGSQVVRDHNGSISISRVDMFMYDLDLSDVREQIDALNTERIITKQQPINQDSERNAFFTYSSQYNQWEFYKTCVKEIEKSAVIGVVSVSLIALVFIPHWSAAPIVLPLMCILYVDMLGFFQWAGVAVNVVSYVILSMSIGLLVDFLMHILLRYYEMPGNRREKVVGTLQTMGSSILLGGITTFLGTLPLAFSTTHVFYTVFISFVGLVTLGCCHGLMVLPVLLATFGTEEQVQFALSAVPMASGIQGKRKRTESTSSSQNMNYPLGERISI